VNRDSLAADGLAAYNSVTQAILMAVPTIIEKILLMYVPPEDGP
jgi:hypothetical protein